jgi:hypothetical protein
MIDLTIAEVRPLMRCQSDLPMPDGSNSNVDRSKTPVDGSQHPALFTHKWSRMQLIPWRVRPAYLAIGQGSIKPPDRKQQCDERHQQDAATVTAWQHAGMTGDRHHSVTGCRELRLTSRNEATAYLFGLNRQGAGNSTPHYMGSHSARDASRG